MGHFSESTEGLLTELDSHESQTHIALTSSALLLEDEECNLFIGDLGRNVNEYMLVDHFARWGDVVNCHIKRDRHTNNSLGYGFVQMKSHEQAVSAKRNLHKTVVGGRPIRIGWAQKNSNLFIGDLDGVSSEMLFEAFKKFGPICDEESGVKGKGNYGFVRFVDREDAERAKAEMDGTVLGNRVIRIGWGDSNIQRNCVHIQFNSAVAVDKLTDAAVKDAFDAFGPVQSVNLPRAYGHLKGFGFVRYTEDEDGEQSAAQAILHYTKLGGDASISGVHIVTNYGKRPQKQNTSASRRSASGLETMVPAYPWVMMPLSGMNAPQGWPAMHMQQMPYMYPPQVPYSYYPQYPAPYLPAQTQTQSHISLVSPRPMQNVPRDATLSLHSLPQQPVQPPHTLPRAYSEPAPEWQRSPNPNMYATRTPSTHTQDEADTDTAHMSSQMAAVNLMNHSDTSQPMPDFP